MEIIKMKEFCKKKGIKFYISNKPEECLRKATHGQRLISLGDHDDDFRCCAGLDQIDVVPTQVAQGVLSLL